MADIPSVTDIHVCCVCEPPEADQRLEPVLEIAGEGAGELRVGQHTMLFVAWESASLFLSVKGLRAVRHVLVGQIHSPDRSRPLVESMRKEENARE